jgi:small-conductance mechanosensitive channel
MLMSKLRIVYENAAAEYELWSKGAQSQMDVQLRERRRAFARRREALQRVQAATGDLEHRIGEVQQQEAQLAELHDRVDTIAARAVALARRGPGNFEDAIEAAEPRGAAPGPGSRRQAVAA